MANALYRKWRPQDWDEVAGQEHVIQTLRNAVTHDRVAHAYLFAGPRGTGKTTSARLLAKSVNCTETDLQKRPCNHCDNCIAVTAGRFLDLIEIDAASNTSVDDVRDLREKINFSPSQGKYKVYIIDEVHMLSTAAFNALLKTLEEPPPHAIFILATTEIHKIPATVLSRCQRHEFRRIPMDIIVQHLKQKSREESLQVAEPVYTEIARQSTGSLRDAISLLDQLTSTNEEVSLEMAQTILGTATSLRVLDIADALLAKDPAAGLSCINEALDSGTDPRQLARQIITYLRNVLLYKTGNDQQTDISEEIKPKVFDHANRWAMADLLRAIEAFNDAVVKEQANWHPGLGLELAFTTFLTSPVVSGVNSVTPTSLPLATPRQSEARKPASEPKSQAPSEPDTSLPPDKSPPKKQPPAQPKSTESSAPEATLPTEKPTSDKKKSEVTPATKKEEPSQDAPVPQAGEEISLGEINQSWSRIKSMVKKHNPRTEGLLNTAKLTGLKDNILILGFASDTLKQMMEKEGNLNLTSDILEEVFGRPMIVQCIVSSHDGGGVPADLEIEKDGMVGTATRDLGGKITRAENSD